MKLTKREQDLYDVLAAANGEKVSVTTLQEAYYKDRRMSKNARIIVLDVMRKLILKTELAAALDNTQPRVRRITPLGRSFKAFYVLS